MGVKYCGFCKRFVTPKKDINWVLFIILLIIGVIPALVYYCIKKMSCPIRNSTNWVPPPLEEKEVTVKEKEIITREITKIPCKYCGKLVEITQSICPGCGANLK
ncbi:MAG: hypothetical protein QME47_04215 [Candidatus Thermoplasmatota archaeon]|nr:hypothetical protein [Candidatus Thermoplasmatota archaeon]